MPNCLDDLANFFISVIGKELISASSSLNILSAEEFRRFWIGWDNESIVVIGITLYVYIWLMCSKNQINSLDLDMILELSNNFPFKWSLTDRNYWIKFVCYLLFD